MAAISFDPLERIVTLLDDAFRDGGWHQQHTLVMVDTDAGGDDEFDLGAKPLPEGSHPLEHLMGFVAPASWSAFGVVCFGRVSPGGRRARIVELVARTGEAYAVTSLDDGTVIDEPGEGSITDALRRCLGLPTPPPPCPTSEFFDGLWLLAVLAAGGGRRRMAWREVKALRPEPALATFDWADLRQLTAAGSIRLGGISADLAAWMDDGMFARFVLGSQPPLAVLLDQLDEVQPPNVMRRLRSLLR